jgi:hypothetical protein
MRSKRKFIVLAFAIASFATLRFTMGPRWHGQHCGTHHAQCEQRASNAPVTEQ